MRPTLTSAIAAAAVNAPRPASTTTTRMALRTCVVVGLIGTSLLGPIGNVVAQSTASPSIYTCVDANGKRRTADRPIFECNAVEQRILNADGSVKRVVQPRQTLDERNESETRDRAVALARANRQDAIRRDRNLLVRYPDEAAHRKARGAALDDLRKSLAQSDLRLKTLAAERKPLIDESEFYVGRQLPIKLRLAIDSNDALVQAQNSLVQNLRIEAMRINTLFDTEHDRLVRLWAGAAPGSASSDSDIAPTASR